MWELTRKAAEPLEPALELDGTTLTLEQVRDVAVLKRPVRLSDAARQALELSRHRLEELMKSESALYGINTGFGELSKRKIQKDQLAALQRNLVLSHAVGVGEPLTASQVRAILLLRANALAKGFSGIRPAVVERLLECLQENVLPWVPRQGSVGSSGDLAPLAHVALALMGEGQFLNPISSEPLCSRTVLQRLGWEPLQLQAKEGLALLNGTQAMLTLCTEALLRGENCAKMADLIGAMTLQPLMGTARAFDERLYQQRPHRGSQIAAKNLRKLLQDSPMIKSHEQCTRIQDAYSLRGMAVVHGASRDAMAHVRQVLSTEINSVTDNPLIFENEGLSGANFHGQPVALVADYLSIALAELGSISERRIERLVNPDYNEELPAFLSPESGLNSGFMVAQYTAAALVSENKSLCHPASVDSIPTSAGKEDHVSMGTIGAWKALQVARNLERILAIEFLCAAQAADLRSPLELSPPVAAAKRALREVVPQLENDRWMQPDVEAARDCLARGTALRAAEEIVGALD